jgi:hypothetical protein
MENYTLEIASNLISRDKRQTKQTRYSTPVLPPTSKVVWKAIARKSTPTLSPPATTPISWCGFRSLIRLSMPMQESDN